jgi:pSer/pThr/pTyr-binding forkhead associated (FHA) protein
MPKLVLIYDDIEVREFPVARQELVIGRLPTVSISLKDSTVSSRHAIVESQFNRDKCQTYYVRDLSSKNGTFLRGRRISRKPLADGDEFKVGSSTFRFCTSEQIAQH